MAAPPPYPGQLYNGMGSGFAGQHHQSFMTQLPGAVDTKEYQTYPPQARSLPSAGIPVTTAANSTGYYPQNQEYGGQMSGYPPTQQGNPQYPQQGFYNQQPQPQQVVVVEQQNQNQTSDSDCCCIACFACCAGCALAALFD